MIAVVDYGMGNLASVAKAVRFLGHEARVTSDPKQLARAGAVILPGVGAFGEAMRELRRRKLVKPVLDSVAAGKPFLGLCLGLQLLFESSEESPGVRGLGLMPGEVRRFPRRKGLKVPHMGWNSLELSSPPSVGAEGKLQRGSDSRFRENDLLRGIPDGSFVYFVHSYFAAPEEKGLVAARTRYGGSFPSVLWDGGRVWATQFHPEKSQKWGLKILANFLKQEYRVQSTRYSALRSRC